ncbi:MAG: class I SAM-dependent methyltransferase [Bacteroidota bacterium]|nr:class I SAM-dependent methyltransferase [Bacteroidota bacterium]
MATDSPRVCPAKLAGTLDSNLRKIFQDPSKILSPYIKEGMTVLDMGCGPGFFTVEIAKMVGPSGKVIAADLQEEMLQILKKKIQGTELESRIKLIKADEDKINVTDKVDFILIFFVAHEVEDKDKLFSQLRSVLKDDGKFLIVEPKHFHVSTEAFKLTLKKAKDNGFNVQPGPKHLFSQSAILTNR